MFTKTTKILLVDDALEMRKVIRGILNRLGYFDIRECAGGHDAWAEVKFSGGIELIISDWQMPEGTGIELLEKIRGDSGLRHTPFLMVSAEGEDHQVARALRLGANAYCKKPFSFREFQGKLGQAFAHLQKCLRAAS